MWPEVLKSRVSTDRPLEGAIRSPSYVWGLIILISISAVLLISKFVFQATFKIKDEIDIFAILGISLVVIPTIELIRTHRLQRSELVRNHVSAFLGNKEITNAYYDLIYNYDEAAWKAVENALTEAKLDLTTIKATPDQKLRSTPEDRLKCWKALEPLNQGRVIGSQLYHPKFFQGSLEEQRLDALLNYFDIVAYNFANGLIDIRDLDGVSSNYIATIGTRPVFKAYISLLENAWSELLQSKEMSAPPPFRNLSALLDELKKYNMSQPKFETQNQPPNEAKDVAV